MNRLMPAIRRSMPLLSKLRHHANDHAGRTSSAVKFVEVISGRTADREIRIALVSAGSSTLEVNQ